MTYSAAQFDPIARQTQADGSIARSLAQHDRAEFAWWLANFSNDVGEQFEPATAISQRVHNWQVELGAARPRPIYADLDSKTMMSTSINDQRLFDAITPQPLLAPAHPSQIPLHVWQNLDWQTHRRFEQKRVKKPSELERHEDSRDFSESDLDQLILKSKRWVAEHSETAAIV